MIIQYVLSMGFQIEESEFFFIQLTKGNQNIVIIMLNEHELIKVFLESTHATLTKKS